jgi:hypothetical protein
VWVVLKDHELGLELVEQKVEMWDQYLVEQSVRKLGEQKDWE